MGASGRHQNIADVHQEEENVNHTVEAHIKLLDRNAKSLTDK